jgi:hypothetical protein
MSLRRLVQTANSQTKRYCQTPTGMTEAFDLAYRWWVLGGGGVRPSARVIGGHSFRLARGAASPRRLTEFLPQATPGLDFDPSSLAIMARRRAPVASIQDSLGFNRMSTIRSTS